MTTSTFDIFQIKILRRFLEHHYNCFFDIDYVYCKDLGCYIFIFKSEIVIFKMFYDDVIEINKLDMKNRVKELNKM